MKELFQLPERSVKPRETGVTMVIDSGLPLAFLKDHLEFSSSYIDYVKLGWGTAVVTERLEEKIALYKSFNIPVCFGGTFFRALSR